MVSLRRYSYRLLACLMWSGLLAGCNNAGSHEASNPYVADFEVLWQTFDARYSYFVFKNIDWQARYDAIRPRFDQVTSEDEMLAALQDLLAPLRDQHVYFRRPDGSMIPTYTPSYPINWDRDVWLAFVQGQGWQQIAPNLGYARIDSLPYIAIGAWNTNQFSAEDFDAMLDQVRESPGLILDVRMNGLEFSVPRWIAYTADQTVIEWDGIPPDIAVPATETDFAQGRDPVLDGAVVWLRERLGQPEP